MDKRKWITGVIICLFYGISELCAQELPHKDEPVYLCEKAEKVKNVFIIDEKYCFVSSVSQNLLALFGGEQLKNVDMLTLSRKDDFKKWKTRFGLDGLDGIQGIFIVQLKQGECLPQSLKDKVKK